MRRIRRKLAMAGIRMWRDLRKIHASRSRQKIIVDLAAGCSRTRIPLRLHPSIRMKRNQGECSAAAHDWFLSCNRAKASWSRFNQPTPVGRHAANGRKRGAGNCGYDTADPCSPCARYPCSPCGRQCSESSTWAPRTKPDQDQLPAVHVTSVIRPDQLGR